MHQPRRKPSLGHKRVTAADRKRRQRNLLPHLKIFFAKTPSTERLPPFWGKPFLDRFLGEGAGAIFRIQKSPLPGGRICRTHIQARLRCAKPRQFRLRGAGDGRQSTLVSPEVAEPVG
jgi:hypothetical protein